MTKPLDPRIIFRVLLVWILLLVIANIFVQFIYLNYYIEDGIWSNNKWIKNIISLFDFDTEGNIPTFYSSLALFFSSVLLWLIALYNKQNKFSFLPWVGLSLIFVFLSIDEFVELHEYLEPLTKQYIKLSGVAYGYWTIPYVTALFILVLIYARFLFSLPKRILKLCLIAGFIFILGAVGFELIAQRVYFLNGSANALYKFLQTCEEFLEMLGVIIFIYALLNYLNFKIIVDPYSDSE